MIKNVGKTDRNIRLAAGGVLIFGGIFSSNVILTIIGLLILATGATGTCVAYMPMKMNTIKDGED